MRQQYCEEDFTLLIQLPRQDKEYFINKIGLITFPEDIEILGLDVSLANKKEKQLDSERSLMEIAKYTQFIS